MAYKSAQAVRFSAVFTNGSGVAVNPTAITFKTIDPLGVTVSSYTPTNDSAGHYHQDVTLVQSGVWYWRWASTGTVVAADEGSVEVELSEF